MKMSAGRFKAENALVCVLSYVFYLLAFFNHDGENFRDFNCSE